MALLPPRRRLHEAQVRLRLPAAHDAAGPIVATCARPASAGRAAAVPPAAAAPRARRGRRRSDRARARRAARLARPPGLRVALLRSVGLTWPPGVTIAAGSSRRRPAAADASAALGIPGTLIVFRVLGAVPGRPLLDRDRRHPVTSRADAASARRGLRAPPPARLRARHGRRPARVRVNETVSSHDRSPRPPHLGARCRGGGAGRARPRCRCAPLNCCL